MKKKIFLIGCCFTLLFAALVCSCKTNVDNKMLTLSFRLSEEDTQGPEMVVPYEHMITKGDLPNVARKGQLFLGWFSDNKQIKPGSTVTESMTVVGRWTKDNTLLRPLPSWGTDGTQGRGANYFLFGEWPQSVKKDNVKLDKSVLYNLHGWECYKGSDNAFYVEVVATPEEVNTSFPYLNGHEGDDNYRIKKGEKYYFKMEPIKWLKSQDAYKTVLIAENIIENIGDKLETSVDNKYINSKVRKYLNEDFYNKAFSDAAKQSIIDTKVDNSVFSTSGTHDGYNPNPNSCENTLDKIFLLSLRETTEIRGFYDYYDRDHYFTNQDMSFRKNRVTTEYARAVGAFNNYNSWNPTLHKNVGYYILRSPSRRNNTDVYYYHLGGLIGEKMSGSYSQWSRKSYMGIVPALRVSLYPQFNEYD